jgi:transcription-repair coupling factor (superfamily II helicase)
MRDLEIRGAGNILGTQQSGHIALVGYELYCQLLEQVIAQLKRLPPRVTIDVDVDLPGEAYIPRCYVPDMRLKIDLYRRLARVASVKELGDFAGELVDRFGPPPPLVSRLLGLAELRILAHRRQVHSIHMEDPYVVLRHSAPRRMRRLAARRGGRLRVADDRSLYLVLEKQVTEPEEILAAVKSLLQEE